MGKIDKRDILIIYRISNNSYKKERLDIPKEKHYWNCVTTLHGCSLYIIGDNLNKELAEEVEPDEITSLGNAGSFRRALDVALLSSYNYFYFVEDDYLHDSEAADALLDGFNIGLQLFTLYDHPDKYFSDMYDELKSQILVGSVCHWRSTPSTTMTFAATRSVLEKYKGTIQKHTSGAHPNDHYMFTDLALQGLILYSSIPGYSTHAERQYLSPLQNWSVYAE